MQSLYQPLFDEIIEHTRPLLSFTTFKQYENIFYCYDIDLLTVQPHDNPKPIYWHCCEPVLLYCDTKLVPSGWFDNSNNLAAFVFMNGFWQEYLNEENNV